MKDGWKMEYVYMIVFSGPRLSRWYEIHRHWALWDWTDVERKGQFERERERELERNEIGGVEWMAMSERMSEWRWRWGWMCVAAIAMAVGNAVLAIGDTLFFSSPSTPHHISSYYIHHIRYYHIKPHTLPHSPFSTNCSLPGWLTCYLAAPLAIWLSILSARYLPRWSVVWEFIVRALWQLANLKSRNPSVVHLSRGWGHWNGTDGRYAFADTLILRSHSPTISQINFLCRKTRAEGDDDIYIVMSELGWAKRRCVLNWVDLV